MKNLNKIFTGLVVIFLVLANFYFLPKVFAGTLTGTTVLELGGASNVTPMIQGTNQSIAIMFTTVSSVTTPTISLDFGSAWGSAGGSLGASGSQTAATNNCTTLFAPQPGSAPIAVPGTLTASTSGTQLRISTTGNLAATTNYCTEFTYTSAVTNPTTPGDYSVIVSDGTDSQTVGIDVLASGANAYSITATIAPIFTMALSSTTDTFSGNLSASAVTTSTGITTTINTNAKSGWFVWAMDSQAGLTSTSASHTIPTVSTGSNHTMNSGGTGPGNEAYALGVSTKNTANYAYGGGTTGGGLSTSTFNQIAYDTTSASNVTFVTHELANITAVTPAATDYTDTITEIGAGSF